MKYIVIPAGVTLKHPLTDEVATDATGRSMPVQNFVKWFFDIVLNDSRMGTKPGELARVSLLCHSFAKAKPIDVIAVEDHDYEKIAVIVNEPVGGYLPLYAMQLSVFSDAVLKATDKNPQANVTNGADKEVDLSSLT